MIYLFAGDDAKAKRAALEKFLKSLPKGLEIFRIEKKDFNPMQIESLYSGAGLFFSKCIVILDNLFERGEVREFLLENFDKMGESTNDFIFLEGKLLKAPLDAFKKARAEINIFEALKERTEKFNSFALADAFGQRNKLNLWTLFRQARANGVELEAIVGILFWKAKDMLVKKSYGKFSEAELQNFTGNLSYLLPKARKEGREDEAALEEFLLEAF